MVIVWKWEDLEGLEIPVDTAFAVHGDESAHIVRINEFKSSQAIDRLAEQVERGVNNGKVLVFIHKDHQYQQDDIATFKKQFNAISTDRLKFVLFGGGQDYIYFSASEKGFLDDFGDFMNEPEYQYKFKKDLASNDPIIGKASVLIETDQQQSLNPVFFNNVWQHYQWALGERIFRFKLAFLKFAYPFVYQENWNSFRGQFLQNRPLLLNVKSFCYCLDQSDFEEIEHWPNAEEEILSFGPIEKRVMFLGGRTAFAFYASAKQLFLSLLEEPEVFQMSTAKLVDIRSVLDQLLDKLAEAEGLPDLQPSVIESESI